MSWHYSRVLVAEYLGANCSDGEQSAPLNLTNTPDQYWSHDKTTDALNRSRYGMTFARLTENIGEELLTLFRAGFHAQTYPPLEATASRAENILELTEKAAVYGEKWRELLKRFGLNLHLLRTPRVFALVDLSEYSKTLTRWGITLRGECLDVGNSAQIISESECLLLPTPTCHNAKEGAYPAEHTRRTPSLAAQVGGKINPDWNEWRMGWIVKWTDLKPLETDKFRQWLDSHGIHSQMD